MLTELFKNAFRATVEHFTSSNHTNASRSLPPVLVTLSLYPRPPHDNSTASYLSIRIRDEGGGIPPANISKVFSYAFTTARHRQMMPEFENDILSEGSFISRHVGEEAGIAIDGEHHVFGEIAENGLRTGIGTIAGLGYGLPMSRIYAK